MFKLFRLLPNTDLKQGILTFCTNHDFQVACIISAVGSLKQITVRIADGKTIYTETKDMEVLSLSGTIVHNQIHAHISAIDHTMHIVGGHLMDGCVIHTTMELCILDLTDQVSAERVYDSNTGYDELSIIE
ncbi:MAG: PPC domain-containing DNA-binding protein [Erysipelotrichaceae bacterium]